MKRASTILTVMLMLCGLQLSAAAQGGKARALKAQPELISEARGGTRSEAAGSHDQAVKDLVKATEELKKSLRELLPLREKEAARETERVGKLKELYADGIISKREFEGSALALASARAGVEDVRKQLAAADLVLAETLAEAEAATQIASAAATSYKSPVRKLAYTRYGGTGNWLLSGAANVEGFFASQFGRRLPVSSFGQSDLHNRLGFDHRNAMDVALHPDSVEGQALINYLQSAGIPFIAFRGAVPGSSSGPHIHVGRPSSRIR
ncbi:MAG: hypothetical protein ACRD68_14285 [Pyrinomonadaceae bacterium]